MEPNLRGNETEAAKDRRREPTRMPERMGFWGSFLVALITANVPSPQLPPPLRVCDPDLECRRDPGQSRQGEAGAMLYIPLPSRVFFFSFLLSPLLRWLRPFSFPADFALLLGIHIFFFFPFE